MTPGKHLGKGTVELRGGRSGGGKSLRNGAISEGNDEKNLYWAEDILSYIIDYTQRRFVSFASYMPENHLPEQVGL